LVAGISFTPPSLPRARGKRDAGGGKRLRNLNPVCTGTDKGMEENKLKVEEFGQSPKILTTFGRWIISFMEAFNLILFVLLLLLAVTQVLFRYMLMIPLPWTEELARFTLVWVTFLGAASVTRRKLHIAVDYFIAKLPAKTSRVFSLCSYSLIVVFLSTVLWGALIMMEEAAPIFAGSIPWLSQMYLYLGAVIGVSFMIFFVSLHLGREIRNARQYFRGQSPAQPRNLES
jgi:TRAP-type C4-dicarboxylate transport system permease small subunit